MRVDKSEWDIAQDEMRFLQNHHADCCPKEIEALKFWLVLRCQAY